MRFRLLVTENFSIECDNCFVMRTGLLGALMDEYERALEELLKIVSSLSEDQFISRWTTSDRFSSIQDILYHTCSAGYAYSDYIRFVRGKTKTSPGKLINTFDMVEKNHQEMFKYTLSSVEGLYDLIESDFYSLNIPVWGNQVYHLEQLLEHAIVHILRHRRQIEVILSGIYHV